jgi:1-acyl-sn-glycerol-3-phosphate acyltransferase
MKAAVLESPFLGGGARWAGYIRNDSGSAMVRAAAEELAQGGHVLIFPEGTRTPQDCEKIGPFKGGYALIARKAQRPTQTIIIELNQRYLGKGWRPWWLPLFPLIFVMRLGRRFDPPAPEDEVKPWLRAMEEYFQTTLR